MDIIQYKPTELLMGCIYKADSSLINKAYPNLIGTWADIV